MNCRNILVALKLSILAITSSSIFAQDELAPIVATEYGAVRGVVDDSIFVFQGIPYAKPPVGNLRWRPPQDHDGWQGEFEATEFGQSCTAPQTSVGGAGTASGDGWDLMSAPSRTDTSEDCLTLNIWTRSLDGNAPVMVFMASVGEGSLPYWNGTEFARDGVVLVTFNHRMWKLNSFNHPALKDQNTQEDGSRFSYGALDQKKLLEWIRDNIDQFGGDEDNVTIFGQSAGGRYVLELMTDPSAEGLFHKAIVQSCCAWSPLISDTESEAIAIESARLAGFEGGQATAEQLRTLDVAKLPIFVGGSRKDLVTTLKEGYLHDIPLLIGGTDGDGSSLRKTTPESFVDSAPQSVLEAFDAERENLSKSELGYSIYTDEHVNAPARWLATEIARRNESKVYRYLFSYVVSLREGQQGAAHTDDVAFIFDSWDAIFDSMGIVRHLTKSDRQATDLMQGCWIKFAQYGDPTCGNLYAWPPHTPTYDYIVELNTDASIRPNYRRAQYDAVENWALDDWPKTIDIEEVITSMRELKALE